MVDAEARETCPLCQQEQTLWYGRDRQRHYLQCPACRLVFVPECYHLSPNEEQAVYDLHENSSGDAGYRRFLSRLTRPLLERLPPGSRGLDFGCGPGPALPAMLADAGHQVDRYDPFYYPSPPSPSGPYDFICATEVVEHLRDPQREFSRLFALLKAGGCLGIMTKLVRNREAFLRWHYIRDPTHVCFYSRATFAFLAENFSADLDILGEDVILLTKNQEELF